MSMVELRNSRISLSLKALGEIPKLKQISPKRGKSASGTNGQGNRSLVASGEFLLLGLIFLDFFFWTPSCIFLASTRLLVGGAYITLADFFGGGNYEFFK